MPTAVRKTGTWFHRCLVWGFTLVLAVLVFWLLGFVSDDVRRAHGPDYAVIEAAHLDRAQITARDGLSRQVADLGRQIDRLAEQQRVIGDGSRSLQQTLGQLIELQRLAVQQGTPLSEADRGGFTASMTLFLDQQRKYQDLSQAMSALVERKQAVMAELEAADRLLERLRQPARAAYEEACRRHGMRQALIQLGILLPVLAAAVAALVRWRRSIYLPLLLAAGSATLFRVALVMHEHFPSRFFKYGLILGLVVAVVWLLVLVIRSIAHPRPQAVLRQYREAYERFLCPICDYPIRTGPRRFLFWNRSTVNRLVPAGDGAGGDEPYTCPCCGHRLFEACEACHQVRHALLPACTRCGVEKPVA